MQNTTLQIKFYDTFYWDFTFVVAILFYLATTFIFSLCYRIRELTSQRIGSLLRISGQVVRTHPVHPELITGTFVCLDCQTVIKDVEQQFKYTQVNRKENSRKE